MSLADSVPAGEAADSPPASLATAAPLPVAEEGVLEALTADTQRIALGIAYRGDAYHGWQSQPSGRTVQDKLESALAKFAAGPVSTLCAGRTDTGVHGLNQVVHFDTPLQRELFSWVRGTNRYLPPDISVQWAQPVPASFHARNSARGRRYRYLLLESAVRPAIEQGGCGWIFRALDGDAMRDAAARLLGEHDFSSFRSSECQALSPIKLMRQIDISRRGAYWRFDFEASAFLHHMVRNLMGCLIAIGTGSRPPAWMDEVLAARSRDAAAPTFAPQGLYFVGPVYDADLQLPNHTHAMDWLP